jgi:amino acid adenylation domain-containing protein
MSSPMDKFSERVVKLSPAKRALFELALKQQNVVLPAVQTIPLRGNNGAAPLSFAQQRLWFLSKFEPDSTAYNQPKAIRFKGTLDLETLKKVLDTIVERHEVLRTTLLWRDGETPIQLVADPRPLDLPMVDLTECSEPDLEAELQSRLVETTEQIFDLSRDLMLRAALFKLGPLEHVLLLVTHHIASDGWSSGILSRELATLYQAFSQGEANPLPELPIQYADYAVWQRNWLQGEVLQTQLSYWKQQLTEVPALVLPTDRPRPAIQSYRGTKQSCVFSKALSERLQALSRNEGVTLFMTLLATFQTLLHRYTGQEDIVVGSPIAGRTRPETEGLIGFFVNMLVLRNDLSGNPTFRELMNRVRKTALEAYEHQDIPFEKLVEELHPDRDLSRSPLFQVMLTHQNVPRQTRQLPDLTVSPVEINNETAKFDLSLYTWEMPEGLKATLEYNTDLFNDTTISRMLGHFHTLLQGIVANPEQRLSDLPILTEAERQQLLVDWNDSKRDYPKDKCIHELIEEQVERSPDAVAIVFEEKQLTYRELNLRANQLAHYLQQLSVGPEVIVGICMERSLEMLVAVLAVLKAGGAYVPLDPSYPKERLAFMLEDAEINILLTQQRLVEGLPKHSARTVCIDSEWEMIARGREDAPADRARPENLAYMIYTSGSTGKSKGVQVVHGAVVNFLNAMRQQPGLTEQDILVAVTTLSFDIAGLELLLPLLVGARLVLLASEVAADGPRLAAILETSSATVMQATPSTWRLLREAGWQPRNPFKVLCGGESIPRDLANDLLNKASSVWNMYGPTETTIWSATYYIEADQSIIPLGRPIDNTQIYILDPYLHPVPIGVPGELYIGGVGLARSYLKRPDLTAEKFVPCPFGGEAGARLYRTGDLARYLPNGNIEFLGRIDQQVKIRGFRIELGEIETVLRQHAAVGEAGVIVREDEPNDKKLVAYFVPKEAPAPTIIELRSFLKQKLPEYMVPSIFVTLDALPLTPNGKVDRRALPTPDHSRREVANLFVAPRTPVEQALADIWAEVLKLKQVGVQDDFFDLGGHSLLATQVTSRVRNNFHIEFPLRALFENPTIADLAVQIAQMQARSCSK